MYVLVQGTEVDVEDIKKVYSLFLDEHRSTQFLQVGVVTYPSGCSKLVLFIGGYGEVFC